MAMGKIRTKVEEATVGVTFTHVDLHTGCKNCRCYVDEVSFTAWVALKRVLCIYFLVFCPVVSHLYSNYSDTQITKQSITKSQHLTSLHLLSCRRRIQGLASVRRAIRPPQLQVPMTTAWIGTIHNHVHTLVVKLGIASHLDAILEMHTYGYGIMQPHACSYIVYIYTVTVDLLEQ